MPKQDDFNLHSRSEDRVAALVEHGHAHAQRLEFEEARKLLSLAVELAPQYVPARLAKGNFLSRIGEVGAAIDEYKTAIKLDPKNAIAFSALAGILWRAHQYSDACALLAHALQFEPGNASILSRYLHAKAHLADWSRLSALPKDIEVLRATSANVEPFAALSLADDPEFLQICAMRHARLTCATLKELPLAAMPQNSTDKIKVGYFSNDFFSHATMMLIAKLFELHDRNRFFVVLYDYGSKARDGYHDRAREAADLYRYVEDMSDQDIAMLARKDGLDVAIDLKGYTENGRAGIFAARAAPVQISFLGYPGTLGLPQMDYIVADPTVVPPELQTAYCEQVLYMPHCYQVNDRDRLDGDTSLPPTRAEVGLPEEAFVFCSFNNTYKITPREFDIWMRLLRNVPGSVLWCFAGQEGSEANLLAEAEQRGVDSSRIIFARRVSHKEHMARHKLADLFLDTFIVNAHTTASDALLAGVPVVTKLGLQFAARVCGSILINVGLEDLVADTEENYETIALHLAKNPQVLTEVRNRLKSGLAHGPLFDSAQFTKDFEVGLELVVQRSREGKPPKHIRIPEPEL